MSGIPSWARVGAKVVCVDDTSYARQAGIGWTPMELRKGEVYTIRGVGPCLRRWPDVGLFLVETGERIDGELGVDTPYSISRFRPLVDDEIEATLYRAKRIGNPAPARKREAV